MPGRPTEETGNYDTDRFIDEPDFWRVQLRTIRGVSASIRATARVGYQVGKAIETAQRYFFGGLSLIGVALGTLMIVVTF